MLNEGHWSQCKCIWYNVWWSLSKMKWPPINVSSPCEWLPMPLLASGCCFVSLNLNERLIWVVGRGEKWGWSRFDRKPEIDQWLDIMWGDGNQRTVVDINTPTRHFVQRDVWRRRQTNRQRKQTLLKKETAHDHKPPISVSKNRDRRYEPAAIELELSGLSGN